MVLRRLYVPEQRMTFGGHLEELRQRIIYAILGLVVAAVVCFLFLQNPLFRLVLGPHNRASAERAKMVAYRKLDRANAAFRAVLRVLPDLPPAACRALFPEEGRKEQIQQDLSAALVAFAGVGSADTTAAQRQEMAAALAAVLTEHIVTASQEQIAEVETGEGLSLRTRTARDRFLKIMQKQGGRLRAYLPGTRSSAQVTAALLPEVAEALAAAHDRAGPGPKEDQAAGQSVGARLDAGLEQVATAIENLEGGRGSRIVAIKYTEQFFTYLKIVLICAIFIAHPFILWQLWRFIGAGLYAHEQRVALTFVPFSLVLFMTGVSFGYTVLIPWGLSYLSSYGDPELVDTVLSLSAYLSLFMSLTVLLGIVFQVPLVMFFLSRSGLVDPGTFSRIRRHAILTGVVLGALLTPPDPFTQVMLAGPLVILYEIGILVSKVGYRKAQEAERRAEEEERQASSDPATPG
jgi:Tat protein translocase TatC